MELHIHSEFDCVYSVNGEFFERAERLTVSEYDIVYVTVFPLEHSLLPYTVKLHGAQNVNSELACGIRLNSEHYLLTLAPRYPIVYGTANKPPTPTTPITRLFALIKSGELDTAYSMLSDSLRSSIDKPTLDKFFASYTRIAECDWESGGKFYLIDANGIAKLHTYTLKDGFIDDIVEPD